MTDREALLRSVLASPSDDLPRLVFADWLEELGTFPAAAWAALIRSQCEYARTGTEAERHRARAALATLGADHDRPPSFAIPICRYVDGKDELPESDPYDDLTSVSVVLTRGFVQTARGPLDLLREHLPVLVGEHPVEVAEATDRTPHNRFPDVAGAITNRRHAWYRQDVGGAVPPHAVLPDAVYDRLPEGKAAFAKPEWADAALSAALLAEARDVPV